MIAYVETSAVARLLIRESGSEALKRYLNQLLADDGDLFSSVLLETELRRAAVREEISQELVTDVLERFDMVELDRSVYREAGLMSGANLRSLDALHVVIALRVGAEAFVTYDQRQAAAARAAGLRTISPE